jgi:peptide methionine sulfoxide reductase msrA/msrB
MTKLTEFQKKVIFEGATEAPFGNEYWNENREGIYVDALSGIPLFASIHKFNSGTGWPSFYNTINPKEIGKITDLSHGMIRTEIKTTKSGAHLGHLFNDGPKEFGGERYCVNSASIRFIPIDGMVAEGFGELLKLFSKEEAIILAGGCFWGMEHLFLELEGVLETRVGYSGGFTSHPTYKEVCTGKTGHAESVEVLFNPIKLEFENLLKYFFQIHDPTTPNRQGNDIGTQYRSAIFYFTEKQKNIAENVKLKAQISGIFKAEITTEITKATDFWEAEDEHQKYLIKHPNGYTCHYIRKDWKF